MLFRSGEDQVKRWRRSYDIAPPALSDDDPRNPKFDIRYQEIPRDELPTTESLQDTVIRCMPYWDHVIFPSLKTDEQILIVAHGNSLRGIIKNLKNISDNDIAEFNIPTGVPYVFEFDEKNNLVRDYYLGDQEEIDRQIASVRNQGLANH